AARSWRGLAWIRSRSDAVGPVRKGFTQFAKSYESSAHGSPRWTHGDAEIPGLQTGWEGAQALWNLPSRLVPKLVARETPSRRGNQLLFVALWQFHESKPIVGGIHPGGSPGIGCDDSREIEALPRLRRDTRRIDETVSAHEYLVARGRQIRHDITPLVVCDH